MLSTAASPLSRPQVMSTDSSVIIFALETDTTTVVDPVHPPTAVPVTVYVVVVAGFAFTEEPVVALNPVNGDHVYVKAPDAVNTALVPLQIADAGTLITGGGKTVIADVAVAVHPHEFVTVSVYVVEAAGHATGLKMFVADNPAAGNHAYVFAD